MTARRTAMLLLVAALTAAPTWAAESAVIKAGVGLGGYARPSRWAPVVVDVVYTGEAGSGEVVVDWGDARVRRAVSLGSETRKEIQLYVRTSDPRDSMTIRLLREGHEIAATETPVRLVAPADAFTVCVATAASSTPSPRCSATVGPRALPHSWRGYGAADEVLLDPGEKSTLTADQQTALNRWRTMQAIENSETSSPTPAAVAAPGLALRRSAAQLLLYVIVLGTIAWPLTRIRARSLALYPAIVVLAAFASVAAVSAGRFGSGATVHVSQSAVIEQVAGTAGSSIVGRGAAEFSAFGAVNLHAADLDGVLTVRSARHELMFDEDGAPVIAGTYGLGGAATFEFEAMSGVEPFRLTLEGSTLRVTNGSQSALRACRFSPGFSRSEVGTLAPGQSVDVSRQGAGDASLTCVLDAAVVTFADSQQPVVADGSALVLLRIPPPSPPATSVSGETRAAL